MSSQSTDIIIIGAGPAGLFAAFYAGMRELSVRIIDALPEAGGQPQVLYPKKNIYDIPGFPNITGEKLTQNLLTQLERFKGTTHFSLSEEVTELSKNNDHFIIQTNTNTYSCRSVIIAAGNGSFKPRKIKLENMTEIDTKYIDYYLPDIAKIKDRTVAVCGGGDSAFDTALEIAPYAKQIYLIHRRNEFRAHEFSVKQAKNQANITFMTPYVPQSLLSNDGQLTQISLTKVRTKETQTLPIDHLCMAYGFVSSIGAIKNWNLNLKNHHIIVDSTMATNIAGIFAIGDMVTYPGKADLIATAFGEAPIAINSVKKYLFPNEVVKPLHSSHLLNN